MSILDTAPAPTSTAPSAYFYQSVYWTALAASVSSSAILFVSNLIFGTLVVVIGFDCVCLFVCAVSLIITARSYLFIRFVAQPLTRRLVAKIRLEKTTSDL